MYFLTALLAAGSLPTLITGSPLPSRHNTDHVKRVADAYVMYSGSGAMSAGWPASSAWVSSFDTMFNDNKGIMKASCAQWGVPNNSDAEITDIYNGLKTVASETSIDARFILAIMMQESGGCVRAPTTNWGVRNPGLMQDHDGAATCNENGVQNPCPSTLITQMIRDGAAGTPAGDGLKQTIAQSGATDDSKFYKGARIYNSGSIDASGDLGKGIATHCYASDIANRLMGWVTAPHGCCLDSGSGCTAAAGPSVVAASASAAPAAASTTTPSPTSAAPAASTPTPTPTSAAPAAASTTRASSTTTAAALRPSSSPSSSTTTTTTSSSTTTTTTRALRPSSSTLSGVQPAAGVPKAPGAVTPCYQWHTAQSGDYCWALQQKYGITFDQLRRWNSVLDASCSNLWLGYAYCVKGPA